MFSLHDKVCLTGKYSVMLVYSVSTKFEMSAVNSQQVPKQNEGGASQASRCFSFWVLAKKGQLRAALNEAGS